MLKDKIFLMKQWVSNSENIVFFGGAGVSTESGIPDFRGMDGIYHMKYRYPPEEILSRHFFMERTKEFFDFYRDKMIYQGAQPNLAHQKLKELEDIGKLKGIITQNIDGLHQMAGSRKVIELHGSIHHNYCMDCNKHYNLDYLLECGDVPRCTCGGIIKPYVVLYEEPLNGDDIAEAIALMKSAEVLMIGGTSLSVYPAAGFIDYFRGEKIILINKEMTSFDSRANLLINASIGEVLSQI